MNRLHKKFLMGGVAGCAVAFASCGESLENAVKSELEDGLAEASKKVQEQMAAAAAEAKTETVSLSLTGLM